MKKTRNHGKRFKGSEIMANDSKVASVGRPRSRRFKDRGVKRRQSTDSSFNSGEFQNPTEPNKILRPCQGKNTEEKGLSDCNRKRKRKGLSDYNRKRKQKGLSSDHVKELRRCDLCGADDHSSYGLCPYLSDIPKDVKTLPPGFDMQCKSCDGVPGLGSCTCLDLVGYDRWRRCAVGMVCSICRERKKHWATDCPEAPKLKRRLEEMVEAARKEGREARKAVDLLDELFPNKED